MHSSTILLSSQLILVLAHPFQLHARDEVSNSVTLASSRMTSETTHFPLIEKRAEISSEGPIGHLEIKQFIIGHTVQTIKLTIPPSFPTGTLTSPITIPPVIPTGTLSISATVGPTLTLPFPPIPHPRLPSPTGSAALTATFSIPPPRLTKTSGRVGTGTAPVTGTLIVPIPTISLPIPTSFSAPKPTLIFPDIIVEPNPEVSQDNKGVSSDSGANAQMPTRQKWLMAPQNWISYIVELFGNPRP